jgi:hypothetical protein
MRILRVTTAGFTKGDGFPPPAFFRQGREAFLANARL